MKLRPASFQRDPRTGLALPGYLARDRNAVLDTEEGHGKQYAELAGGMPSALFSPGGLNDPQYTKVSLLLHADNAFNDSSQHRFTVTNTACTISPTHAKFGNTSCFVSASSVSGTSFCSIPDNTAFDLSTGDWSLDLQVWLTNVSTQQIFIIKQNGTAAMPYLLYMTAAGKLGCEGFLAGGSSAFSLVGTTTMVANQWNGLQATRAGNVFSIGLNGGLEATVTAAVTLMTNVNSVVIGNFNTGAAGSLMGWWDECRITKGAARALAVQTAPFPNK